MVEGFEGMVRRGVLEEAEDEDEDVVVAEVWCSKGRVLVVG